MYEERTARGPLYEHISVATLDLCVPFIIFCGRIDRVAQWCQFVMYNFNSTNMYVFAANVSLAIPWRMLGFMTFLDVLSLSK